MPEESIEDVRNSERTKSKDRQKVSMMHSWDWLLVLFYDQVHYKTSCPSLPYFFTTVDTKKISIEETYDHLLPVQTCEKGSSCRLSTRAGSFTIRTLSLKKTLLLLFFLWSSPSAPSILSNYFAHLLSFHFLFRKIKSGAFQVRIFFGLIK